MCAGSIMSRTGERNTRRKASEVRHVAGADDRLFLPRALNGRKRGQAAAGLARAEAGSIKDGKKTRTGGCNGRIN